MESLAQSCAYALPTDTIGPLDQFEPAVPVLILDAPVIVAIVVQQLELAGRRPFLNPVMRDAAEHAAELLLAALDAG